MKYSSFAIPIFAVMTFFYVEEISEGRNFLGPEESNHVSRVLRLRAGQQATLLDGKGKVGLGTIELVDRKRCLIHVTQVEFIPRKAPTIHMAIAPTKSIDRFEFFLEKATELGVSRITPIITKHSERRKLRHDRSLKILVSAMKQCQRAWLPQLDELLPLQELLQQELPKQRYFGWCAGEHDSLMNRYSPSDALMLIGPEGDFNPEEASILQSQNFEAVSIGKTRLRTETAAIAACAWMNLITANDG